MEKISLSSLDYLAYLINSACSNILVKCIGAWIYIVYTFSFGDIQGQALIALFVLIIFDFITGFTAAKMVGEEIEAKKILHTPIKMIWYYILIASAHLTGTATPIITEAFDYTVTAFLAITEFIFIMENLAKMGIAIPQKMLNKLEAIKDEQ